MNNITSAEFNRQNNVIFRAKIGKLLDSMKGPAKLTGKDIDKLKYDGFDLDYIDVNSNGRADFNASQSEYVTRITYFDVTEPILSKPYQPFKEAAERRNIEILKSDKLSDLEVNGLYLSTKRPSSLKDRALFGVYSKDSRPLSEAVKDIDPLAGNNWAIDVTRDEFVIYEPKK